MSHLKGNWSPPVRQYLTEWLENIKNEAAKTEQPLTAVFDLDNTCFKNDVGEALFHFLVDEMLFAYGKPFYELVGKKYHGDEIEKLVAELLPELSEARFKNPKYDRYRKLMMAAYYERLKLEGPEVAYSWAVQIMNGMSEERVYLYSCEVLSHEMKIVPSTEEIRFDSEDPHPVSIARGIKPYPEIRMLMNELKQIGFEIWIVSASCKWSALAAVEKLKLPVSKVFGMSVLAEYGFLKEDVVQPIPVGKGKADIISRHLGTEPIFVVGDSLIDFDMLEQARDLALFFDYGNEQYRNYATSKNWLIQPAFSNF